MRGDDRREARLSERVRATRNAGRNRRAARLAFWTLTERPARSNIPECAAHSAGVIDSSATPPIVSVAGACAPAIPGQRTPAAAAAARNVCRFMGGSPSRVQALPV